MRTIYIDNEFKCHISDDGNMTAVETDFFDNKCDTFIEGYIYIPYGESRIDPDGTIYMGRMIAPWKSYDELNVAQREYETQQLAEYSEALQLLGVDLNDN